MFSLSAFIVFFDTLDKLNKLYINLKVDTNIGYLCKSVQQLLNFP